MECDIIRPHTKFQFVNENELQKVIDKVRRHRMKCKEKEAWSEFCHKELQKLKVAKGDKTLVKGQRWISPHLFVENKVEDDVDYSSHNNMHSKIIHLVQADSSNEDSISSDNYFRDSDNKSMNKSKNLSYSNLTSVSVPCAEKDITIKSKLNEFMNKFEFMCLKIMNILEVIEPSLNEFHVPETPKEILQYQKKASEFCIRFSRNNFYQIETQFKHFNTITIKDMSSIKTIDDLGFQIILKLSQVLLTGYYTFYRHMHIVWGYNGVAEKLVDLFEITQKFVETIRKLKEIEEIANLKKIKILVKNMIESSSNFLNNKFSDSHSVEKKNAVPQLGRVHSANSINENTQLKPCKFENCIMKRRIKSANDADPYYMYKNKQTKKKDFNCKICISDQKKCDKPTLDVFKRLTMQKNYLIKQNMYSIENKNKLLDRKVYQNKKKHIVKNKNNVKFAEKVKSDNSELKGDVKSSDKALVNRLIPLIADHFGEVYNIPKKKKVYAICKQYDISVGGINSKNDIKKKTLDNNNVKTILTTHKYQDEELEVSFNKLDKIHTENDTDYTKYSHDFYMKRSHSDSDLQKMHKTEKFVEKPKYGEKNLNKISNDLITNELSLITIEIDKPFEHFIKKEVEDFSNFFYKTCSFENKKSLKQFINC